MKNFFLFFIAAAVLAMGLSASLVYTIDPKRAVQTDINSLSVFQERNAKPWLIQNYKHNAVLLGTSKFAHVDPSDIDTPGLTFFNASFSGALPEEMLDFLNQFVPHARLVILSFDLMTMNELTWGLTDKTFPKPSALRRLDYTLRYLVSMDSLKSALIQLVNPTKSPGLLRRNGGRYVPEELERSKLLRVPHFEKPLETLRGAAYQTFKYSDKRVEYLRKIKALLDERHIQYIVLISPEDEQMMKMIKDAGSYWALQRFRTDIAKIYPSAIDYSESWMSNDSNFFNHDPLHYMPKAGAVMVREAMSIRLPPASTVATGQATQ